MPVNLTALSNVTTSATALSNLILVTPNKNQGIQPQNDSDTENQQSPNRFLFDYEGEQAVTMSSDITDHFAEDNKALQDQIALKPIMVTTHGFIGELNDVVPPSLEALKTIADKLTVIDAYTPALSQTALIAYNNALFLYNVALQAKAAAVGAWNSVSNGDTTTQNKQQKAFAFFSGYWEARTLFTIQTPWAIYQNMAIQTLRAVQEADTRMITDFEVTFKQMRFAQTLTTVTERTFQGRAQAQAAKVTDLGTYTPPLSSTPFLTAAGI